MILGSPPLSFAFKASLSDNEADGMPVFFHNKGDPSMTEQKKPSRKLPVGYASLQEAEAGYQKFYAVVQDLNTTIEDLQDPAYWAHHAQRFQVGGGKGFPEITMDWEDGSKSVHLKVLAAGPLWAKVVVLNEYDLTETAKTLGDEPGLDADQPYFIQYKGPTKKFCVIRTKDQAILKEGFALKSDAQKELESYSKGLAA